MATYKNRCRRDTRRVETRRVETRRVETRRGASLQQQQQQQRTFGPLQSGSLAALVNGYKGAVTRWCRKNGFPDFAWQAGFWDHVIRSERSLNDIRVYIENNARKWALDRDKQKGQWV